MTRAGREILTGANVLFAVPLHWHRQWTRRFNQSTAFAGAISSAGCEQHAQALAGNAASSRAVEDRTSRQCTRAFRVSGERRVDITGRRVVLVDDVLTSSATVDACARALLRAGAAHIDVLVFALVVAPARAPI